MQRIALVILTIFISPSSLPVSSRAFSVLQPLIALNYPGTAVETHYIAIDLVSSWTTNTGVEYSIEGAQNGSAIWEPRNQSDYVYNQTLFRISGLENTEHTLRVELLQPSVLLVRIAQ